jgi:hypothetical protein
MLSQASFTDNVRLLPVVAHVYRLADGRLISLLVSVAATAKVNDGSTRCERLLDRRNEWKLFR